jgi:hypothetical protein
MQLKALVGTAALAGALLVGPGIAAAQADSLNDSLGPRAIALGEALRAGASGASSISLNPAGVGLSRNYVIEANYGFRPEDDADVASISVCDSTRRLAACLYYNYFSATPDMGERTNHDFGASVAVPVADRLLVGVTTRYVTYSESGAAAMPDDNSRDGAFVADSGLIVKLSPLVHVGLVGHNVIGYDDDNFPRAIGTGVSLYPTPAIMIGADARWNLDVPDGQDTGRYSAGLEYFLTADAGQQGYPLRLGYVYDAAAEGSYLTGGIGFVTPRAGLEVGARKQVGGEGEELMVLFGLKLFLPN